MLLSTFTWSQAKDNGAGTLENPNGDLPSPQNFRNMDADYGTSAFDEPYNSTTSFVWELPFGRGKKWMSRRERVPRRVRRRLDRSPASISINSGEAVTLRYTPGTAFQVSGINQDFRGANNYRPNVIGDPYGDKKAVTGYLTPLTCHSDRPEPAVRQRAPQQRSCARLLERGFRGGKDFPLPLGTRRGCSSASRRSTCSITTNFRAPNSNRSTAAFGIITQTWDARQIQLGVKLMF